MTGQRIDPKINAQWARVRGLMRSEVGDAAYRSWLRPLALTDVAERKIRIAVPTRFMRDWVVRNYGDRIRELWRTECPEIKGVDLFIETEGARPAARPEPEPAAAPERGQEAAQLSSPLDPRFTFDAFVVGKPNELAYAAARRVAESTTATFNPLFLYGGVGLGKTHLMMAVGHLAKQVSPQTVVEYLTLEEFVEAFHAAVAAGQSDAFRNRFANGDVLLIDDVQFLTHRREMQAELLRLIGQLQAADKQIVLSSDRPPSEIEGLDERLVSGFAGGVIVDMSRPGFDARLGRLGRQPRHPLSAMRPAIRGLWSAYCSAHPAAPALRRVVELGAHHRAQDPAAAVRGQAFGCARSGSGC